MSAQGSAQLPRTGDIIDGKYVLESMIGQGGMGAVYKARHIKLQHAVAIKVMLADAANHEAATRFVNEGRAAANIQNEHVVRVSDVDEENGYAYMVLELLEGEDLAQVLDREHRLPAHVAVGYVLQALDGVKQAHAQGIVHRDLKPSNLFLARRPDGSNVVKVLDFGISKANAQSPLGQTPGALTSTKAMLGSPLYMSPEQLRSSKSVDARADIWAFGIIMFELMTGTLPFLGENLGELFAAILENDAPPLRSRAPEISPGLENVVARCLQRRPEHRIQTVADLERELASFTNPAMATGGGLPLNAGAPNTVAMMSPMASGRVSAGYAAVTPGSSPPPGSLPMGAAPPPGYAITPQYGASTGSGVVKGTVPLGANTPQPHRQTGSTSWQSTGSETKGSKGLVYILSACGVMALIGIGLIIFIAGKVRAGSGTAGNGSAGPTTSETAPTPSSTEAVTSAPTPPSASGSVAALPSVPPSATAVAVNPHVGIGGGPRHLPPKIEPPKIEPPKIEPPKIEPPKIEPPKAPPPPRQPPPPPPPPPPSGPQQNSR